jgi:hypothetical protein
MENEQVRRHRVEWGLAVAENTLEAPSMYERDLLEKYVRGILSLEEVILLVEIRKHATKSNGTGI